MRQALALDAQQWHARERPIYLSETYATLTKREQQLLNLIVTGSSNKDIARKLDISIKTVQAHRARLIKKLAVKSLAGLAVFGVEYRQYHDPT